MKYAFLASLMIHASVFLYFSEALKSKQQSKTTNSSKKEKTTFIPKPQEKTVTKITLKTIKVKNKGPKKQLKEKENETLSKILNQCKDKFYYGIGITLDFLDMRGDVIDKIAPGYAADRAGLKVGDIIIGYFDIDGVWKKGVNGLRTTDESQLNKVFTIAIRRGYVSMNLNLVREKICILPTLKP